MKTIVELNEGNIKDKIYTIRGVKVMLDFELAAIYGYSTKDFNRQVRNNIRKFPVDFMFQLTRTEVDGLLRCKIFTSSWGGTRYLPYAFTEQGIYMLMTVLKGEEATRQSIAIIRVFKMMKDYIIESNQGLLPLVRQVDMNTNDIKVIKNDLKVVMDNFVDPSTYKEFTIFKGQRIESDIVYMDIYKQAKHSIYIIDNYADIKTLKLLKCVDNNLDIIIFTDVNGSQIESEYLDDFIKDTKINVTIKHNKGMFHDRYVIIDYKTDNEKMHHCGFSSKDGGNKVGMIQKVEYPNIYHELIDKLLK